MKLKDKIGYLRKQKGYTLKELADRINLAPSTVFAYEHGDRTPIKNTVIQLALVFDVDPDYLKDDE